MDFSISDGIISKKESDNEKYIQFTAPVSHGSSGGGLFNEKGDLIGIVTSQMPVESAQNINFAIPINKILTNCPNETVYFNNFLVYLFDNIDIGSLCNYYMRESVTSKDTNVLMLKIAKNSKQIVKKKGDLDKLRIACSYLYLKKYLNTHDSSYLKKAQKWSKLAVKSGYYPYNANYINAINAILTKNEFEFTKSIPYVQKVNPESADWLIELNKGK